MLAKRLSRIGRWIYKRGAWSTSWYDTEHLSGVPSGLPPVTFRLGGASVFIFHTCSYISPFPGRASTSCGAPPLGLDVSPCTDVQRAFGHSHRRGEKVLVAPVAASAVGICGLLTVGYPSIADSGGYGWCGFRLRACRAGPPPLGAVCASPLVCLTARRGCLSRTSLWGIQWGQ